MAINDFNFHYYHNHPIVLSEPFKGGGFARLDGNLSSDNLIETTSSKVCDMFIYNPYWPYKPQQRKLSAIWQLTIGYNLACLSGLKGNT